MATPRKHWFRVQDSILHETWPIELKGVAVNLMAYLNTRWAREGLTAEQACSARLSPAACMLCTGSQTLVKARSMLGALAVLTGLKLSVDGADTLCRWPKFSEAQGLASLKLPESRPRAAPSAPAPAPSPAPAPANQKERRESAPAAPRTPAPNKPRVVKSPAPESLAPSDLAALELWCRERHPELELQLEDLVEACLGFHRGAGNLKADWYATCQTWIRNESSGRFSKRLRDRPQTFHEISVENTKQAARDSLDFATREVMRRDEERAHALRLRIAEGRGEASPGASDVLVPRARN